ncbi:MAG: HAMP domain-containing protein, partial [Nitrospirae bacterium]
MTSDRTLGRSSLARAVTRLCLGLGLGLALLVAVAWWATGRMQASAAAVAAASRTARDEAVDLALKAEAMRLHVVQVQQFLTDISATRGRDGLNTGFDEAEAHAKAFHELLATFRDHYGRRHDTEVLGRLDRLGKAFDGYYRTGRQMAEAYVKGGPSAGNRLMGTFDAAAEQLAKEMDPFVADQLTAVDEEVGQAVASAAAVTQEAEWIRGLALASLLLLGLGTLLFRRGVARRVLEPLAELVAAVGRVAEGDLKAEVAARYDDEIGDLASSFNRMTEALRAANDVVALKAALDAASTNIMVAGRDRVITYVNEHARATFARLEGELRKLFPSFRADGLVGRCIDDFHSDPARVAAIIDDPGNLPHTARIEVGPFVFRHTSSPVFDETGAYVATVVEWDDVTEEVRLERETRRLIEGVPRGRLDLRIDAEGFETEEYRAQARRLNAMLDSLAQPLAEIRKAAAAVERSVEEIASGFQDLDARSRRQVASLESTASAMEEMAEAVGRNAENAH